MAIEILPPDVVNQIAAGEVLERPANLLKELIENSLDAGADEIDVQFDLGGRNVSVSDNGAGMSKSDLALCLQRHSTSKITLSADLFRLATYGFRGEALASIAGVSDMTVVSKRQADEGGFKLQSRFGAQAAPAPVAAKTGTEIHVRELFANVPARLEFMKSDSAEHTQIRATLKAMALAREDVGFSARSKGELVLHWNKNSTFIERARDVLQNPTLFTGNGERDGIRVEVAVGSPRDTQAVNRSLWFFVQGRWVQDRSLTAAVMEAYRTLLMHGEFPMAVVRIQMPPESVDVNVHPTKSSVKFRDNQAVFRAVAGTIRTVLEKAPWLTDNQGAAPAAHQHVPEQKSYSFSAPEFSQTQYSSKVFPLAEVRQAVNSYQPTSAPQASNAPFKWRDLQVVGQIHLTYVVAQSADSLYLIDQHAAHERVMFERLMQSFNQGRMDVQTMLLPLSIDLPESDVEVLLNEKDAFEKMGLTLERMGPQNIVVQTLPSLIQEGAVVEALKKAAQELTAFGGAGAVSRMVNDIFATMACHSVVRAGQVLSTEQMHQLLVQMDEFPLSSFCPHGRPVFTQRRFQDIEREFGRIN